LSFQEKFNKIQIQKMREARIKKQQQKNAELNENLRLAKFGNGKFAFAKP